MYEKYTAGKTVNEIATEYGMRYDNVKLRIDRIRHQKEISAGFTDFLKQFTFKTAERLDDNGIRSEEDLYKAIEAEKPVHLIGKTLLSEVNEKLGIDIKTKVKDGQYNVLTTRSFYRKAVSIKLNGQFCGTIDGKPITGFLKGDYVRL